jgi:peptidoglycan/xylan/chitin deacetylase (PgdA/CDA1 family)
MARRDRLRRLRWHVKAGAASVISRVASPAVRLRGGRGYRPLVLGYHRVVDDFDEAAQSGMAAMLIGSAMFERHLDLIGRRFRFVSIDEVGQAARERRTFDQPVAAVTFDDGYRDVYEHAIPILKRKGIPAAMFVVTDLVGRSAWQVHDKLYHLVEKGFRQWRDPGQRFHRALADLDLPASRILGDPAAARSPLLMVSALLPNLSRRDAARFMSHLEWLVGNGLAGVPQTMTWPLLQQMQRDGFVIGSHTRTHVSLPMESPESAADELVESKRVLEQHLGVPIDHFAYPGGQFTPDVVEALEQSGYRFAYTACPHADPRHPELTIERLLLWEKSSIDADGQFHPALLECQARGMWPPARICRRAHA